MRTTQPDPTRIPDDDPAAANRRRNRRLAPAPLLPPPPELLGRLRIDANGFTFDPVTGMTYNLSPNGVRVVRGLIAAEPLAGIASGIAAECDITPERSLLDVERFLGDLRREFLPGETRPSDLP
jgi:hypothetical protein